MINSLKLMTFLVVILINKNVDCSVVKVSTNDGNVIFTLLQNLQPIGIYGTLRVDIDIGDTQHYWIGYQNIGSPFFTPSGITLAPNMDGSYSGGNSSNGPFNIISTGLSESRIVWYTYYPVPLISLRSIYCDYYLTCYAPVCSAVLSFTSDYTAYPIYYINFLIKSKYPEMVLQYAGIDITNSDTPTSEIGTDFGFINYDSKNPIQRTFTIYNSGGNGGELRLSPTNPYTVINNTNNMVSLSISTVYIPVVGKEQFTVDITPSYIGSHSIVIYINSISSLFSKHFTVNFTVGLTGEYCLESGTYYCIDTYSCVYNCSLCTVNNIYINYTSGECVPMSGNVCHDLTNGTYCSQTKLCEKDGCTSCPSNTGVNIETHTCVKATPTTCSDAQLVYCGGSDSCSKPNDCSVKSKQETTDSDFIVFVKKVFPKREVIVAGVAGGTVLLLVILTFVVTVMLMRLGKCRKIKKYVIRKVDVVKIGPPDVTTCPSVKSSSLSESYTDTFTLSRNRGNSLPLEFLSDTPNLSVQPKRRYSSNLFNIDETPTSSQ